MAREEAIKRPEPVFAPLIGRHVECDILHVSRYSGKALEPAFDEDGQPIELLADDDMPELLRRICEPGRYRVAARDPQTRQYIAYKDYLLRPRPKQNTQQRGEASDQGYINHLRDNINDLREQLREAQARAERDIRYERDRAEEAIRTARERTDEAMRTAREQIDAATRKAYEAEVKLASYGARLDARETRVAELEHQISEMKGEVESARELATELKQKAEASEFSPFDALVQVDQALDVLGKTIDRFSKPK